MDVSVIVRKILPPIPWDLFLRYNNGANVRL